MSAQSQSALSHHKVVVVGAGAAGLAVTAGLLRRGLRDVLVIDPAEFHYYQPLWTLVGGGVVDRAASVQPLRELIPPGARWQRAAVTAFEPEESRLWTSDGKRISYEFLVVAPGLTIHWDRIDGLLPALGHHGVCSNYSFETVESTWREIQGFTGGDAVFTFPTPPIKCAGAPQKIMYLAEDYFRRRGIRQQARVHYYCATPSIFSSPHYARALQEQVVGPRDINTHFRHELVAVRAASREAVFRDYANDREIIQPYRLLHVAPPMGAPEFLRTSALANEAGYCEVDKETLQHLHFPNVFSLGDASSLPTSKTAAAIRAQLPVLLDNLFAARLGLPPSARYDGYTSCPLVTGYGRLILAEFGYTLEPQETFPFDQSKERRSMYWLKQYVLPQIYWRGLIRGARWPVRRHSAAAAKTFSE